MSGFCRGLKVQASVEPRKLSGARQSLKRLVDRGPGPEVREVDRSPDPARIAVGAVDHLRGEIQSRASGASHVSEIYIIFRTTDWRQ